MCIMHQCRDLGDGLLLKPVPIKGWEGVVVLVISLITTAHLLHPGLVVDKAEYWSPNQAIVWTLLYMCAFFVMVLGWVEMNVLLCAIPIVIHCSIRIWLATLRNTLYGWIHCTTSPLGYQGELKCRVGIVPCHHLLLYTIPPELIDHQY